MLSFRDFHGDESEFSFLMFIAENAQVLEKMILVMKFQNPTKPEELGSKMIALDNARWASGSNKVGYMFSRLGEGGAAWNFKSASDLKCNDPFFCL